MEFETNKPIYLQVVEKLKKEILLGTLKEDDKLLSARDLALKYKINPNTANRVYKELEQQGWCYTKRGMGTYVISNKALIEEMRSHMARQSIIDFLETMTLLGYSEKEIIALVNQINNEQKGENDYVARV